MACYKCGYIEKEEKEKNGIILCKICFFFSPDNKEDFEKYIEEKIDWKNLDSFRKYNQQIGSRLKKGMSKKAEQGKLMARPPLGYDVFEGELKENQDAAKVRLIFKRFLEEDISLNKLSKEFSLSVNGLKKILSNRTYLGEIKFAGSLNKGFHTSIISPEIFYAVQRKLKEI